MSSGGFYAYCVHVFALLKTGLSNRNLNKKGLKIESFLQKKTKTIFFCFFFWYLRPKSQILTPHPCPPFWKFFIRYIEQCTKTFCKNTGRPGRLETSRLAGQPAMILKFTGRVEKILTGSISGLYTLTRCLLKGFPDPMRFHFQCVFFFPHHAPLSKS